MTIPLQPERPRGKNLWTSPKTNTCMFANLLQAAISEASFGQKYLDFDLMVALVYSLRSNS